MPCATCNDDCRQGRDCPYAVDASRAAIGLAPLHQQDGGHYFHDGIAFPIGYDQPLETPESAAERAAFVGWVLFSATVIVCGVAKACGMHLICPWG